MINSSDNLLYNLSYLSSVIHPVIILRLLEHRIFTPLFKKKSAKTTPTNISKNNQNNNIIVTPNIGISAPTPIPVLIRPDTLIHQQRCSSTKHSQTSSEKNRKTSRRGTPSTSISGGVISNPHSTIHNDLSSDTVNLRDLSSLLSSITTNNVNQATTRKWFWRNSEKPIQPNMLNDRNPLLQAIVENDLISSSSRSVLPSTNNIVGVGEIKLFEKELLNLPSFQLSDSQNPLLPSPTCLNYDFPTQFYQTSPPVNVIVHAQDSKTNSKEHSINYISNSLQKLKSNDNDCK